MWIRLAALFGVAVTGMLVASCPGLAQKRGGGGVETLDFSVVATGLEARFPEGFGCEPVASPFASPTRYDGSSRRGDRNGGLHGGLDITLPEGTPLLAAAAGEVVAVGQGGRLEGNFLWLRHAPADTGRPFWIFSKYQHLSALPTVKPGERVAVGQVVAQSGSTGTAGGHYPGGYPHLHWGVLVSPSGDYQLRGEFQSRVWTEGAELADPLVLFPVDADRKAMVAAFDQDGVVSPPGARIVWPVRCRRG